MRRLWFLGTLVALTAMITLGACAAPSPSAAPPTAAAKVPAQSTAPVATAAPPAPPAQPAPATRRITVGSIETLANAGFILAEQRGYYREEGLDVELTNFPSGGDIVAPLSTGQLDVGNFIPSVGYFNALQRNVNLRIVASSALIKPRRNVTNLVVRKELNPGPDFVDLASLPRPLRAAAAGPGILTHAMVLIEAERAGILLSDVDMTFLSLPDMNGAFRAGLLDVAASGEPLITIGEQQGVLARWKPTSELFPDLPFDNLVYGTNLLERDRAVGERFVVAYLRGVRDYESAFRDGKDKAAVVGLLSQTLRIPATVVGAVEQAGGLPDLSPDGKVDPLALRSVVDFWVRTGQLQPGIDLDTLVDASFARMAVDRLGSYR